MIKPIYTKQKVIDNEATGAAIRAARKQKKKTLYQVAVALRRSKAYVSMLELGKRTITEEMLKEIGDAINGKADA